MDSVLELEACRLESTALLGMLGCLDLGGLP